MSVKPAHPRYLVDAGSIAPEIAAPLACSGFTTYAALKKIAATASTHTPVRIGSGGLGLLKARNMRKPVVVGSTVTGTKGLWQHPNGGD